MDNKRRKWWDQWWSPWVGLLEAIRSDSDQPGSVSGLASLSLRECCVPFCPCFPSCKIELMGSCRVVVRIWLRIWYTAWGCFSRFSVFPDLAPGTGVPRGRIDIFVSQRIPGQRISPELKKTKGFGGLQVQLDAAAINNAWGGLQGPHLPPHLVPLLKRSPFRWD